MAATLEFTPTLQLNYLMNINSRVVDGLNDDVGTAHSSDSILRQICNYYFLTKLESWIVRQAILHVTGFFSTHRLVRGS